MKLTTILQDGTSQFADLIENTAVHVAHDIEATLFKKGQEIQVVLTNGRACEVRSMHLDGLPAGYTSKYQRYGEVTGPGGWSSSSPLFIPARFMTVRRLVPLSQVPHLALPIDQAAIQTTVGLYSGPLGLARPLETPESNDTGGSGLEPFAAHDELRQDLIVDRCPVWCTEHEQVDGYYRGTRGPPRKTTQFKTYVVPVPATSDPDDRTFILLTPITASYAPTLNNYTARDYQHCIRDYRLADPTDPAHRMFLQAYAREARYEWAQSYVNSILANPGGHGSVGRACAWVSLLAARVRDDTLGSRLQAVIKHVALPNGITQRVPESTTTGFTPNPWTQNGVPHGTAVAQTMEMHKMAVAMHALGMHALCDRMMTTLHVENTPMKWTASDTGAGAGITGMDAEPVWAAFAAWARCTRDRDPIWAAMLRTRVPKNVNQGGSAGPYPNIPTVRAKLLEWGAPGKCSDTIAVIDEFYKP